MSRATQLAFLTKLHKELSRTSTTYKKLVADRQVHVFSINKVALKKAVQDLLDIEFPDVSKTTKGKVLSGVGKEITSLIMNVNKDITILASKDEDIKYLTAPSRDSIEVVFPAGGIVYNKVRKTYSDKSAPLVSRLNHLIKQHKLSANPDYEFKDVFSLNTKESQGLVESQAKDALNVALSGQTKISEASARKFFKEEGATLSVFRNTSTNVTRVSLESKAEGGANTASANKRRKILLDVLERSIVKLGKERKLLNLEADVIVKVEKTVKKNLTQLASRHTNIRTDIKPSRAKKAKGGKSTLVNKSKTAVLAAAGMRARKPRRSRLGKKGFSQTKLLGYINSRLQSKVAENMGTPALNMRTGVFASSVRATSIFKNGEGFPVIRYTYQKDPYQLFEPGRSRLATPGRNPVKLIDRSVRQIASEIAIGRFYTRRI
jgi:hypothetical protein